MRKLTERALKASDALIRNADITLHFTYASTPLPVMADETRMEQAITNLLNNAIKFTPAGGSIWVDIEREAGGAVIRVRDNGAGIDAEDLPRIFDMYYQGSRTATVNGGLGIGLLLVQRIVALHGGSIEAKSAGRGHGSEFIVRMLLSKVSPQEAVAARTASMHGMRILVVDDNTQAADSLVRLLRKLGADARAVYCAKEALGEPALHDIDAFLLDVGMPEMDGYELVHALRARGISAPIIALTGYGLVDDKKRAIAAGFTSHLTKPVGIRELCGAFEFAQPLR